METLRPIPVPERVPSIEEIESLVTKAQIDVLTALQKSNPKGELSIDPEEVMKFVDNIIGKQLREKYGY